MPVSSRSRHTRFMKQHQITLKVGFIGQDGKKELRMFSGGELTIGRGTSSEILLDDVSVSRGHALVYVSAEGVAHVRDLASANGTFINGYRVHDRRLAAGDRLRIGNVVMQVSSISISHFSRADTAMARPAQSASGLVTQWPQMYECVGGGSDL